MSLFLTVFVTLYAAMNSYVFWKVHQAFPNMGRLHWVLGGVLLLLVAGPLIVRLVDRAEHRTLADAIGIFAYGWMAVLFWFCCMALMLDFWNLIVWGVGHWAEAVKRLAVTPRLMLLVIGLVVTGLLTWSVHEAFHIRLEKLTIRTAKLPPGAKPIRIAQVSDLHLGGGTSNGRLEKAARLIEEAAPDLIVNTGDVMDSPFVNLREYAERLATLHAPLGKWSIPGNHEYYVGLEEAVRFNEAAGFRLLRGEAVKVTEGLWIAGADDPAGRYDAPAPADPLPVPAAGRGDVIVLLKHRPAVQESSIGQFDLQLSGHTHGGQIFPFNFFVGRMYPCIRGYFDLGGGSALYVSRGTGTWGPPMRLGSPPEVTLITIEPAEQK